MLSNDTRAAETLTTRRPRLALMFNAFWINQAGMSGGDRRCIEIFRRINNKFDIRVFTSHDGQKTLSPVLPSSTFDLPQEPDEKGGLLYAYLARTGRTIRTFNDYTPDIIYGSSDFFPDVVPSARLKRVNPSIRWVQCIFHVYPSWRNRPGQLLRNMAATMAQRLSFMLIRHRADAVICLTPFTRDQLILRGFNPDTLHVNPCGIDLSYFENIHAVKKPFHACFLGRLAPSKGIFDLPIIWKQVMAQLPAAHLHVIGNGPPTLCDQLRNRFHEAGLTNSVTLHGYLPDAQAYPLLKSCSAFVFPSHEEGFGMAIAEAIACGLESIAWDLDVYHDLYPTSLHAIPLGDHAAFAAATVQVLRVPSLASNAPFLTNFDWQSIAAKELALLLTS